MLRAEREKQIRKSAEGCNPDCKECGPVMELLTEIDRLREPVSRFCLLCENNSRKLAIAVEALEFYAADDIHEWEFDVIDFPETAKEALSKIRNKQQVGKPLSDMSDCQVVLTMKIEECGPGYAKGVVTTEDGTLVNLGVVIKKG